MARGPIELWNGWATQILVLLSLALQLFLFIFARTRRRGSFVALRLLLWLAYLMADSTAVYTLGHLSFNGSLHEHKLVVLWVPFLLLHLGSQDTITAYALEDNQLWPRHLLNLGVQAFGVAYVLYKHTDEIPTSLVLATVLMFVIGVIKYAERIWALKCATLDSIRSSIDNHRPLPTYYDKFPPTIMRADERYEEDLLLFAQAMLPVCMGAMVGIPMTSDYYDDLLGTESLPIQYDWSNWKATCKVMEMELSLMYDILYTKTAVIHTWYGYLFRLVSSLGTVAAFVLFQLSGNKNDYSRVDIAITYILLAGAFLFDMASVFSTLGSTWTCSLLWSSRWRKLGLVVLSLRRHIKAARGSRGWSGTIGQLNLFQFCSRDSSKLSSRVAKMMGLGDWWNKWYYSETLVISEDIKELVFICVWKALMAIQDQSTKGGIKSPFYHDAEDSTTMMPHLDNNLKFCRASYKHTAMRRMQLAEALDFGAELQEVILTWHVLTDVFLVCSGILKDATSSTYVRGIKALSNYMVFLIAIRPDTIPGLELRSLYQDTRQALQSIWLKRHLDESGPSSRKTKEETLASILLSGTQGLSIILSHGTLYAKLLLELADRKNPDKLHLISRYINRDRVAMEKLKHLMPDLESSCRGGEFDMPKVLALILDAWVRLLVLASVRCSREAHARQISRGSELTTVVWLMEEHASAFFRQSSTRMPNGRYMN